MKMYLESGYINMEEILKNDYTFVFIAGGRGTGKTYGGLLSLLHMQNEYKINRFMYLRRTQKEVDAVSSNSTLPFKKINDDKGLDVGVKTIRSDFYGYILDDEYIGYSCALSTFENLRGVDFSDVDIIFYDEFIPKKRSYVIKDEYETLLNLYETVNRNRELEGFAPCKLVCCSNSNFLANKIFLGLNVIPQLEKILLQGGGTYYDKERSLQIIILKDSPISEKKSTTALYRLSAGTAFADMALGNEFADNDNDLIRPSNIKQYTLLTTITGIAIYKHKSYNEYYCCSYDKTPVFTSSERDLEKFRLKYWYLSNRYIDGEIFFENLLTKYTFMAYNKLR